MSITAAFNQFSSIRNCHLAGKAGISKNRQDSELSIPRQEKGQDVENRVLIRLETKTQVSRTSKLLT